MALVMPEKYKQEILKLAKAGFEVYLVGGCVRDHLLSRPIKDFDIITTATPDEGLKVYPNAITLAKKFGVLRVPVGDGEFLDVATARKDGPYTDQRHPDYVEYSSVMDDLKRRDFTVNALLYDIDKDEVVDMVGGLLDLQNKVLKAVGKAEERFQEDPLRIWRGVRFQVKLGFKLEAETKLAMQKLVSLASTPSKERIYTELKESCLVDSSKTVDILNELGLMDYFKPNFKTQPVGDFSWEEFLLFAFEEVSSKEMVKKLSLTKDEVKFVEKFKPLLEKVSKFGTLSLKEKNRLKYHPSKNSLVSFLLKVGRKLPNFNYESKLSYQMFDRLQTSATELMNLGLVGGAISTTQKELMEKVLSEEITSVEEKDSFLKSIK